MKKLTSYRKLLNSYSYLSGKEWICSASVTKADLQSFEDRTGFRLPDEFKKFYLEHNGVGVASESGEIEWLFVPIENLSDFTENQVKWIRPCHPDLARSFLPFINFLDSGDYFGYLFDKDGAVKPGLYDFCHEYYLSDPNQPVNEFLRCYLSGIEDFLTDYMGSYMGSGLAD